MNFLHVMKGMKKSQATNSWKNIYNIHFSIISKSIFKK